MPKTKTKTKIAPRPARRSSHDFVVRLINLDRSPDRLAAFRADNPHLPIERFPAIDGKATDRAEFIRQGLITEANEYTPPAIGAAASHIALWQACAAGTEPFLIAEDDAILHRDFAALARAMLAGLAAWDVVFWGFNFDWPIAVELAPSIGPTAMLFDQAMLRDRIGSFAGSSFRPAPARLLTCAGVPLYSISPVGARRYLDRCLPIDNAKGLHPLDMKHNWSNHGLSAEMSRHHGALAAYIALPPLAVTPNFAAGTHLDPASLQLYRDAAERGDPAAATSIGEAYEAGSGVAQDYAEAMRWYARAAALGESQAMARIGRLHARGQGVAQDYAAAMIWYRKAAALDHREAVNNIGFLYGNGLGVARDHHEAMRWYQRAVALGSAAAMTNIGGHYYRGLGVAPDLAEAVRWFKKAAAEGDESAKKFLATLRG